MYRKQKVIIDRDAWLAWNKKIGKDPLHPDLNDPYSYDKNGVLSPVYRIPNYFDKVATITGIFDGTYCNLRFEDGFECGISSDLLIPASKAGRN